MTRVLTFSTNISAGHRRAAEAVAKAILASSPEAQIRERDALTLMGRPRRRFLTDAYLGIIRYKPGLWDRLYRNKRIKARIEGFGRVFLARAKEAFEHEIDVFQPNVIICTQAIPARIIAELKSEGACRAPLLAVATDYGIHPYWAEPNIDGYAVPCPEAAAELIRDGVEPAHIHVTGIPVESVFERPPLKAAARARLGLRPNGHHVLVMGGGNGLGLVADDVLAIEETEGVDGVIVITGCNERLAGAIDRLPVTPGKERRVLSMVHEIEQYYAAADILVSKPGGLTMSEATAMSMPIIMIAPLPGQELRNAEFLLRSGAALMASGTSTLQALVGRLIEHPAERESLSRAARGVGRPEASGRIASLALEMAVGAGVAAR